MVTITRAKTGEVEEKGESLAEFSKRRASIIKARKKASDIRRAGGSARVETIGGKPVLIEVKEAPKFIAKVGGSDTIFAEGTKFDIATSIRKKQEAEQIFEAQRQERLKADIKPRGIISKQVEEDLITKEEARRRNIPRIEAIESRRPSFVRQTTKEFLSGFGLRPSPTQDFTPSQQLEIALTGINPITGERETKLEARSKSLANLLGTTSTLISPVIGRGIGKGISFIPGGTSLLKGAGKILSTKPVVAALTFFAGKEIVESTKEGGAVEGVRTTAIIGRDVALIGGALGVVTPRITGIEVKGETKALTIKEGKDIQSIQATKGTIKQIAGKEVVKTEPFEEVIVLEGTQQKPILEVALPSRISGVQQTRTATLSELQAVAQSGVKERFTDIKSIDITRQIPLAEVESPLGTIITGVGRSKTFSKIGEEIRLPDKPSDVSVREEEALTLFEFQKLGKETKIEGITKQQLADVKSEFVFQERIIKQEPAERIFEGDFTTTKTVLETKPQTPIGLKVLTERLDLKLPTQKRQVSILTSPKSEQPSIISGVKPITDIEITPKTITETITKPKEKVKSIEDLILTPVQEAKPITERKSKGATIIKPIIREDQIISPIQDTKPIQEIKPIEEIIPIQDTKQKQDAILRQERILGLGRFPSLRVIEKPIGLPTQKISKQRVMKQENLFRIEVGKRERKTFFEDRGLTLRQAFEKGAKGVESTPAATFRVFKGEEEVTLGESDIESFFGGRIRKGAKGGFVEKRKFRISSLGELRGITQKGIQASRGKKNRLF